ncbi:MAG: threonine--tRNA ligase, partial [Acidobacteriaceae bacterium]
SLAHVMAAAVQEIFPDAQMGVGPVIENGFYYDFLLPRPLEPKDLKDIEKAMRKLIKSKVKFEREELDLKKGKELFDKVGQKFKVELISDLEKFGTTKAKEIAETDESLATDLDLGGKTDKVSVYRTGKFIDLCRGPHVSDASELNSESFKLDKISGAYWRGKQENEQMQRIYGVAFENKEELEDYLKKMEEAKKRDHRKLGRELDLFTFSDLVGSGLPLFTPKGALVRRLLNNYIEELQTKKGYTQVWTPQIVKSELFKISGHYAKYKNDMFRVDSNYSKEEFFLKPMNCPQHTQIYASQKRSYRDLPLRYSDFSMLYRDEKPGELGGLMRVRSFSQDDCHIFCREDQVDEEVDTALAMTKKVMETFGFKYRYRLSTRDPQHPEKYIGDPKTWDRVEKWAEKIMQRNKIEYFDGPGEAAFYAPKMDLLATDVLGREWQLSTVQIDYFMPERFGLTYIDNDGKEKRPVMLHRAIIGSAERFMAVLIEQFSGAFPVWLSPVQAVVLPISEKVAEYSQQVMDKLEGLGVRVEIDVRNESIGKKIRESEMKKTPYMLVIGEKEAAAGSVAVRARNQKDLGAMEVDEFAKKILKEIEDKSL